MSRTTDQRAPAASGQDARVGPALEEGMLRRWSRRKAEARQDQHIRVSVDDAPSEFTAPSEAADAQPHPAPPTLTDADMPPIDSLTQDSDYRPFMSSGVSEELRTLALRRMFHSGLFQDRCPLDGEYYDCHGYEPLGSVITHEMREEMERAAKALQEQAKSLLKPDQPQTAAAIPAAEAAVSPPRPDPSEIQES